MSSTKALDYTLDVLDSIDAEIIARARQHPFIQEGYKCRKETSAFFGERGDRLCAEGYKVMETFFPCDVLDKSRSSDSQVRRSWNFLPLKAYAKEIDNHLDKELLKN